jgi:hypothetical protein
MKTPPHIKMKFICNQDWDMMKITESGRFCNLCKQEVFDFSKKTIAEINLIKEQKGQLCGNFRIDQVEQGLKLIKFPSNKKAKYWFATLTTFIGLELTQVKGQNKNEIKTEINADSLNKNNTTSLNPKCDTIKDDSDIPQDEFENKDPFLTFGKRKYYWTKKFPFVATRRKHYLRGKF